MCVQRANFLFLLPHVLSVPIQRVKSTMLREVFKNLAVMMSTAVAIPYTIAILCNVLYGWPMSRERLKDSLSVKKVCALNFAVIQQMKLLKYVALYIRWKCFYKYFDSSHLVKVSWSPSIVNHFDVFFWGGGVSNYSVIKA